MHINLMHKQNTCTIYPYNTEHRANNCKTLCHRLIAITYLTITSPITILCQVKLIHPPLFFQHKQLSSNFYHKYHFKKIIKNGQYIVIQFFANFDVSKLWLKSGRLLKVTLSGVVGVVHRDSYSATVPRQWYIRQIINITSVQIITNYTSCTLYPMMDWDFNWYWWLSNNR